MLIDDMMLGAPSALPEHCPEITGSEGELDADRSNHLKRTILSHAPCAARYDVNNLALLPIQKFEEILRLAWKAPMFPPFPVMWLEYRCTVPVEIPRHKATGRTGILVRFTENLRRCFTTWKVTEIEGGWVCSYGPGILVSDDWNITAIAEVKRFEEDRPRYTSIDPESDQLNRFTLGVAADAGLVATVIRLLNWDREVVPTSVIDNSRANKKRAAEGRPRISSPTLINISNLLNHKPRIAREGSGERADAVYHPVAGCLCRVSPERPLFGHRPIPGKTCGLLPRRPHFRGNPQKGIKAVPKYTIKTEKCAL